MEVKLKAERRDETGKGAARRIRAGGKVPGILYGPELETMHLTVDARDLWHALHTDAGTNVLIDLKVDGDEYLSMPREVQRDILKGTLLHVDFIRIRRDVAIQVNVPVHLVGESVGAKEGGVVEHQLWELNVECLPTEVPEHVEVDVSELAIGDALHVEDIKAPQGVTVLNAPEETVVTVIPPPVLELPEEEAPEVELTEEELAALAEAGELPEGVEAPAVAEGEEGAEAPAAEEEGGEEEE